MTNHDHQAKSARGPAGALEVFAVFLKLGLTSFGGPIAHLGYFRREFVERRAWVSDGQFAQLLALCQFLPGPASSQLGFTMGLLRGGWRGALAAFVAFTFPSALLLFLFALIAPRLSGPLGSAALHGLKLVALAVVAHGVVGMAKKLCPDAPRAAVACLAALLILIGGGVWLQLAVVGMGAVAGFFLLHERDAAPDLALPIGYSRTSGWLLWVLFLILLVGLPVIAYTEHGIFSVASAFYRAGALVFGGGHVVLPFLEEAVVSPGWLTRDDFMAGYGAAQAVPGPMFSLAAYLGAHLPGSAGGLFGALLALASIFLPGLLLVSGALPLWHALTRHRAAARIIAGINAAVVGLLAAALYQPVWTSAVRDSDDLLIGLVGFLLLAVWRLSALVVVVWCVMASLVCAVLI